MASNGNTSETSRVHTHNEVLNAMVRMRPAKITFSRPRASRHLWFMYIGAMVLVVVRVLLTSTCLMKSVAVYCSNIKVRVRLATVQFLAQVACTVTVTYT